MSKLIFGTYADSARALREVSHLESSLRTFGGGFSNSEIRLFMPQDKCQELRDTQILTDSSRVRPQPINIDPQSIEFFYSGKVFAASLCEHALEQSQDILVWLDCDTIFLRQPDEFDLPEDICFGYRPVMHNLISSLYTEAPNEFWTRVYNLLNISGDKLFPMLTHTDRQEIRPYFNCGVMAVRPQRGIFRKWLEDWKILYSDPVFIEQAKNEKLVKIFLHQAALVGAVLNLAETSELMCLPDSINYPLFFKEMYGADHEYDDLTDVTTLRYDIYFRNPAPDWVSRLKGPQPALDWLAEHLGR